VTLERPKQLDGGEETCFSLDSRTIISALVAAPPTTHAHVGYT